MRETDQRADERQSGPLPARGRPARREHLPDRPRPLRQHAEDARGCARRPGSASTICRLHVDGGIVDDPIDEALEQLDRHVEAIMVDFDIDVIDRAQCPGAPGARPGGLPRQPVLRRRPARSPPSPRSGSSTSPNSIPSLDVSDITALTAGRWVCEVLAGYSMRAHDRNRSPARRRLQGRRCAASPRP